MEKTLEEHGSKRLRKKREVAGGSTGLREKTFLIKEALNLWFSSVRIHWNHLWSLFRTQIPSVGP